MGQKTQRQITQNRAVATTEEVADGLLLSEREYKIFTHLITAT